MTWIDEAQQHMLETCVRKDLHKGHIDDIKWLIELSRAVGVSLERRRPDVVFKTVTHVAFLAHKIETLSDGTLNRYTVPMTVWSYPILLTDTDRFDVLVETILTQIILMIDKHDARTCFFWEIVQPVTTASNGSLDRLHMATRVRFWNDKEDSDGRCVHLCAGHVEGSCDRILRHCACHCDHVAGHKV